MAEKSGKNNSSGIHPLFQEELDFDGVPGYELFKKTDALIEKYGNKVGEYVTNTIIPKYQAFKKTYQEKYSPKVHEAGEFVGDAIAKAVVYTIYGIFGAAYYGYKGTAKALNAAFDELDKAAATLEKEGTKAKNSLRKVANKILPNRVGATGNDAFAQVNEKEQTTNKKGDVKKL